MIVKVSNFKGTDKKFACQNPTLQLSIIDVPEGSDYIIVETVQTKTRLVLVYESDKFVLRKFNLRGEVAGRVYNNWSLIGDCHG